MEHQFFPTGRALAHRCWKKFKNKNFVRVMDPSAGEGDLLKAIPEDMLYHFRHRDFPFDVCEIDAKFHPILREQKRRIVGHDFLQYTGGAWLSHFIMNPPFAYGVEHVLHAWDILWDGEIVAIINAETIRNPFSAQRRLLVRLIEQHGDCEFVRDAFNGPDAMRKTDVEVAIVYLRKCANLAVDITGDLIGQLRKDQHDGEQLAAGFQEEQQLAHCNSTVENMVLVFDAAVHSMRAAAFASAKATYYARLLGQATEQEAGAQKEPLAAVLSRGAKQAPTLDKQQTRTLTAEVMDALHTGYLDLKHRAWNGVLKSSSIKDRLSSLAQKRLEAEFDYIKELEFTAANVYGFLLGVLEKQSELQIEMACDVFDTITKYHSENLVYYKGWKSNDRHRTCGMRLRTNRFILPGFTCFFDCLTGDSNARLADFDKVFAMLDGKFQAELGLVQACQQRYEQLRGGERVESSYFEVRYYPLAGTMHFFPRDKVLVDRLNRMVGRQRQWLPPADDSDDVVFWEQYNAAEKLDKELRKEVEKAEHGLPRSRFAGYGALGYLDSRDASEREVAARVVYDAATAVLKRHGIDYVQLDQDAGPALLQLPLAAA